MTQGLIEGYWRSIKGQISQIAKWTAHYKDTVLFINDTIILIWSDFSFIQHFRNWLLDFDECQSSENLPFKPSGPNIKGWIRPK